MESAILNLTTLLGGKKFNLMSFMESLKDWTLSYAVVHWNLQHV